MSSLFVNSPDGTRIAYDRSGTGPALVLLHGGGNSRQDWHEAGYVKRLGQHFTVIPIDLRGHGESGMPVDPEDYTVDKMIQDVLAVADACGAGRFSIWGFSFGGKAGRYLAARSERVARMVLMGTPLGSGVSDEFRQYFEDFCAHWRLIFKARRDGLLYPAALSPDDQELLQQGKVPSMMAWGRAMIDWPDIGPADFLCPTLWLVGSEDRWAMVSVKKFEQDLKDSKVQLQIIEGLDHGQVFHEIDRVFPVMLAYTRS
jgi:pimeloyl-ACP methyl ester carboxylesterase